MLIASHTNQLGIAVNEIQRTLGDVPNDFEAGYDLQYTPVRQGWYVGYPVTGGGYASKNRCNNGFGDTATTATTVATPSTADAAVQQLAKASKLQVAMQVIATLSIVTVAGVAVARAIYETRHGVAHPLHGRARRRRR